MKIAVKYAAIAGVVSLISASSFAATTKQETEDALEARSGTGLICDTEEQVDKFIALTKTEGGLTAAIEAVNAAVGNPQACGLAKIHFVDEEEVRQAGTFKIVRVLVVGVNDGEKWFSVQPPHFQFTIFDPDGQDA